MASKVFGTTKTSLSSKREVDLTKVKCQHFTIQTNSTPVNNTTQQFSDTRDWYSKQQSLLNKEQAELDRDSKQGLSVIDVALHKERILNNEQVVAKTTTQGDSKMAVNTKHTTSGIDADVLKECEVNGIKPVITTQEFTNLAEYNASLLNTDKVETDTVSETTIQTDSGTERIATEILNLRIDKGLSWKACRAKLGLSNKAFHKGIRLTDVYRETAIEILNNRIADGWTTSRKLSVLVGIDNIDELLNTNVVEMETHAPTTTHTETVVETLNTDEVIDDDNGYDELSEWEKQALNEWEAMHREGLNNDVVDEDEVVETTTQTESEVVETTKQPLGFFGKLNAIVAILKQ